MKADTKVAVVIPCRNEAAYISLCLDSLVNCNYEKALLEVFVCDGMSTDGTPGIVSKYAERFPFIKLLTNTHITTPFALNQGIQQSTADVMIVLGAHAEIAPDYIDLCLDNFKRDAAIGCVGGVLTNVSEDRRSAIICKAMSSEFGVGNAHFRTGNKDGYVNTVAFGAYRKEVFEKIGYFDTELIRNQDDEFNFRLLQSGYKIYLSREITAKYYVRASYRKLYKQYFQYGYWKVYVNVKHKTVTTLRQIVPFLFVVFLIGGTALSFFNSILLKMFLGVMVCYLLAATLFARKQEVSAVDTLHVVWCFFLLHFSYGWGYLLGLFDFVLMQKKISNKYATLTR